MLQKNSRVCNGNTLFSYSEMMGRKSINQEEFEEKIMPIASSLIEAVLTGFEDFKRQMSHRDPNSKNRNTEANEANGYIQGRLAEVLELRDGKYGRKMLYLDNDIAFITKKVNSKKEYSCIPSKNSEALKNQQTGDADDVAPLFCIGYEVNRDWTSIEGIYAIYQKGEEKWVVDISTLIETELAIPIIPIDPIRAVEVKTKAKAQRKKKSV